jgi:hypothetical protein
LNYINRLPKEYNPDDVFENPDIYQELSTVGCILRFKNDHDYMKMYSEMIYLDDVIVDYKEELPKLTHLFNWEGKCRECDKRKKISVIRQALIEKVNNK